MGLGVLCALLALWLVWYEIRFQKLEDEVVTLTEKTTEILKAYYEEIDYLKDTLTEIREKTSE